jgi:hypothetical protein
MGASIAYGLARHVEFISLHIWSNQLLVMQVRLHPHICTVAN